MVIKAKSVNKNNFNDSKGKVEIDEGNEVNDGIVIVLLPIETWIKVQEISNKIGIESAAVLSVAIERLDEDIRSKDDA